MTKIRTGNQACLARQGINRTSVFHDNVRFLCRECGIGLSSQFAKAIKNPEHILNKYFSKVHFRRDRDIVAARDPREMSVILQRNFLKLLGISEKAQKEIKKMESEIWQAEFQALQALRKGDTEELAGKDPLREGEASGSAITGKYVMGLPSGHAEKIARLQKLRKGIPEKYWSILIYADIAGEGRISLDYMVASDKKEHTPGLAELPITSPLLREALDFGYSKYGEVVEESSAMLEEFRANPVQARIQFIDECYRLNDYDSKTSAAVAWAEKLVQAGRIDRAERNLRYLLGQVGEHLSAFKALKLLAEIRGREYVIGVMEEYFGDVMKCIESPFMGGDSEKDPYYEVKWNLVIKVLAEIGERKMAKSLLTSAEKHLDVICPELDQPVIVKFLAELGEITLAQEYAEKIEEDMARAVAFAFIKRCSNNCNS